jgi:uncharacterized membrane protein HdeD (DUF308 family)
MTSVNSELSDMQRAVKGALGAHWRLLLFQGVALIVLGVLAICVPLAATVAVEIFLGWLFLIGGIVGLIAMFSADDIPAFLWSLITAALSVAVGVLLIWRPIEGALSLTLALTAFFVAEGVFQIVSSIAYRKAMAGTWGWMLASGAADLVLAAIIIAGWPLSAAWTLGLLAGVNLLTSGWAIVMVALAARETGKTIPNSVTAARA